MKTSFPWWVSAVVVVGAVLMGAGGLIALIRPEMLVSPYAEINAAAHVYAGYFIARNLAMAAMLLITWGMGARRELRGVMALAGTVQLIDAVFDATEGRLILVPGVLILGLLFLLAFRRIKATA